MVCAEVSAVIRKPLGVEDICSLLQRVEAIINEIGSFLPTEDVNMAVEKVPHLERVMKQVFQNHVPGLICDEAREQWAGNLKEYHQLDEKWKALSTRYRLFDARWLFSPYCLSPLTIIVSRDSASTHVIAGATPNPLVAGRKFVDWDHNLDTETHDWATVFPFPELRETKTFAKLFENMEPAPGYSFDQFWSFNRQVLALILTMLVEQCGLRHYKMHSV